VRRAGAAAAAIVLLAGCGGAAKHVAPVQPRLPRALAADLRAQADAVAAALAAGDSCTAQARAVALRTAVIDDVHRVPARFRETLLGAANDLADRIACVPPPAPAPVAHGKGHERHGHEHGKHGKHGKDD
jgi:hypothetical protein